MTEPLGEALQPRFVTTTDTGVRHEKKREQSLSECVRTAVKRYLKDLGDHHEPDDLYRFVINEVEKPLIEEALDWVNGNQSRCACVLGISRGTLRKKLKDYGLL